MGGEDRNGAQLLDERYRLVEQLGAGGMSVVWRGYDEVLGRQVAVKVLASRLASDRAFRHRIRIEAQAAARLCHPNITNVYDYGESQQVGLTVPYVVMELVDGGSLAGRLSREGQLPWREAVAIGAEVSSALATAHSRGVVHRDVTPGNVMLTPTGVKVVDFGISALVGESEKGPDGALLGTPAYLAPERLDNGQVSPATDVYAVGLLLYRMLTGRLPWEATTTTQMLRAHMYSDPDPMPSVPGLPDEVTDLVRRCLAKRPGDRPATAELARTLAEAAGMPAAVPVSPAAHLDPAALASAGTTILPWSAATDALPLSRTRNRARRVSRRRQVEASVAAVGLIAVTGAMWGFTSRSPASGEERPTEARMGLPQVAPCEVSYALRTDSGKDFTAELTLTNTGERELRDWTMSFTFPGQQKVTKAEPAPVRQDGGEVQIRPAEQSTSLAPGAAEKVTLTGSYSGSNPLPVEFRLGDAPCGVRVSGVAGTAPAVVPPSKAPAPKATTKTPAKTTNTAPKAPKKAAPKPEKPGKGKGPGGGPGKAER
ncbi:serine/threonine-protein kinase [Micromonospora profundi]|uniref:non-specific serine/threonine protein kinase n=1 Tax=Micromonospora profundi TaxID=1420889 RepID=A0AAJ6L5R1_9ACTN|nr:serine/threonine-protein kinase [Micromonospora profundi]NJC16104.1 serine/threonine-protein kinase [Micromonospora profundi]WLS47521.1 serine/threonine-protein kinase [Micromonospora profundi]